MREWPKIEEVLKNLYRIEIPLPGNPLKAVNSYLIKSAKRNLMIDTGMNRKECLNAMKAGLRKLGVDLWKTDFFITHLHIDHLGLVSTLAEDSATVYFNQPDAHAIRSRPPWDDFINFARVNGFPEDELQRVLQNHPGYQFGLIKLPRFHILKEGDTISVGEYLFKCIETPGHTRGHICLYESSRKAFIAGDHILNDITPNIQLWSFEGNPLKEYLSSLNKVFELDVEVVLPGHRGIFQNCHGRIQELKHHHQRRLEEVLSILKEGPKNAFQVASLMSWEIAKECGPWDLFPVMQKWFATGEAIAHLQYLENKKKVKKEARGQNIVFSLKSSND